MTAHHTFAPVERVTVVTPIKADVYPQAMAGALSAGLDWPRKLRHAQVLSTSDDPRHRRLAEHIRDAHELHRVGLLKPARLDLTPEMRVRPARVTVVAPPPYSPPVTRIRDVLAGACVALAVAYVALLGVMVW